jgi:transposase
MQKDLLNSLEKILLPVTDGWQITQIQVDEQKEEVHVYLHYGKSSIEINGKQYKLYDHREERQWRHLDLWQYKTFILASVPRYKGEDGIKTLEVPWSDAHERMTWMLEKKR